MYRALILKELHDLRGVIAVAAVIGALITAMLAGAPVAPPILSNNNGGVPAIRFTSGSEEQWLTFLTAGMAIVMGFWQSALEIQRGTALYLFHRPLPRRKIVLTKLLVGVSLQMAAIAIPILTLGVLAGWPGFWPAPFYWGMTLDCWVFGLWTILFYLGAFASGWLDGRWWGARLMPLAATAPMALPVIATEFNRWWLLCLLPCGILLAMTAVLASENRDY